MNETAIKQESPLNQIDLSPLAESDAVQVKEIPFQGFIVLRGDPSNAAFMSACEGALKLALPTEPNTILSNDHLEVLWYGPNEWLLVTAPSAATELIKELRAALKDCHAAVTEVGGGNTTLEVSGPHARDLLLKGTPLDLHPSEFGLGQCAQTVMAKAGATVYPVGDGDTFRLIIRRSFADYLGTWLLDAAEEFVQH